LDIKSNIGENLKVGWQTNEKNEHMKYYKNQRCQFGLKLILITLFVSHVNLLLSKSINAASITFSDVNAAVQNAVSGDIVYVPAGISDWGTNMLSVPGGVYLKGAGKDQTKIKRSLSTTKYLIQFNGGVGSSLSDMTLEGCYNEDEVYTNGVRFYNGCVDFRVFNCLFKKFAFSAVNVGNSSLQRGVIHNNEFLDNFFASIGNYGYGVVVYGNGVWTELELGTENAVFVEDNYFSGNRHDIASNNASKYVFRYNQIVATSPAKNFASTDAHGLSSSPRGSRSFEIYNNSYTALYFTGLKRSAVGIRGGDGVIFNNTCTNRVSRTVELSLEGGSCGTYPVQDQIRSLYIWDNESHDELGYTVGGIANNCPSSIMLNRDYFVIPKPDYSPYVYPHPLRTISDIETISSDIFSDVLVSINKERNSISIACDNNINQLEVFNLMGKLVYYNNQDINSITIDMSHFMAGVYIVKCSIQGKIYTKKIIY